MRAAGSYSSFVIVTALLFSGCAREALVPVPASDLHAVTVQAELEELRSRAISPEGWVHLAPGFAFRPTDGGVGFQIAVPLLDQASMDHIEEHVEGLRSEAATEEDMARLASWERAWENTRYWFLQLSSLPAEDRGVILDRFHRSAGGLDHGDTSAEPLATDGCVAASAMPTSGSPGAKGYATASCSGGGPSAGYVYTESLARAGSNWPTPCNESGWNSSQCSSVAYGTFNCYSAATAAQYIYFSGITYQVRYAADDDDRCTY